MSHNYSRQSSDGFIDHDERSGLLGRRHNRRRRGHSERHDRRRQYVRAFVSRYVYGPVSTSWADLPLLFCYIITGLLDSSSTYTWGSFVSMQTGNSIFFGSGVVAPHADDRWIRAAVSIAAFCVGSFIFGRFHSIFGGRARWVVVISSVVQLLMVIGAAVMITVGPRSTPETPVTFWVLVPLGLLAFQSGGQAVISRVLGYKAITSVVLTAIYVDLFSDDKLFVGWWKHPERNRRLVAPLLLLFGAVIGGLFAHSPVGMMGAMWLAVGLKGAVVVMWLSWAGAERGEEEEREEADS